MKITLLLVGKTNNNLYIEGIKDYTNRINHYIPFNIKVIPELKNTKNLNESQQKDKEGELILKTITDKSFVVLLDEHGKEFRSIEFASWLENKQQTTKEITFIIGGPYGFSKAVYNRANEKISLSKMTLSHQMVRLFFTEQVYRACTIIKNENYHHE
ncbi:23S rRNA (pseudouridine(1915)-N(3))-methyltransferase RlmH [uncultured Prevotella sp.]|uniref:23S rRNA (pseudouridine(1915)-N(3))-methyltransferase RlmH n=1 Tax=uncultured Prevotella sp. TaxID=159272 RepID=UPI0026390005|nr:23S rRNA (pseudouridine(1915)-N(3))-methyltransferase RlmH [uncultured Prevotella sp.]